MAARMQAELDTAKTVQDTLFPKTTRFETTHLKLIGKYQMASECGGDWWWYWQQKDHLFVLIADATGHGAPAALITSAARSAISILELKKETNLETIAETLNFAIYNCGNGMITMSAFLLSIPLHVQPDLPKTIQFVNCSHLGAIILPSVGIGTENFNWRKIETIDEPLSPSIGQIPTQGESPFRVGQFHVIKGQRMVLLTDGLIECTNKKGEMMGDRIYYTHMINLHKRTTNQPGVFSEGLFEISRAHVGSKGFLDDLTAVVIDF